MFDKFLQSVLDDMDPKRRDALLWSLCSLLMLLTLVLFFTKGHKLMPDFNDPSQAAGFSYCLLFLFVIIGLPLTIVMIKRAIVNKPVAPNTFGSAHFATPQEARAIIPTPQELSAGDPYLFLGKAYGSIAALSLRQQESHVLLVAPTGQGKTSGIIITGLLAEIGKRSLFINDTKMELVGQCFGWLARYHQCFVLIPILDL